jgi:isopentenyl diphosphate isomerase/L-lactate dehydrogenase-like FMN-dependent dehydrogenase
MDGPIVTVEDYEPIAAAKLPREVYDYYAGGAGSEWTLRENRAAFDRWILRPRVLVGAEERDTSTEVVGTPISLPVIAGPWAFQGLAHPDGEVAVARAAAAAGTISVFSSTSSHRIEAVAAATRGRKWFQLYVHQDRDFTRDTLRRAREAGFEAIVFTADAPYLGKRERDRRNVLQLPVEARGQELDLDPAISWDDLAWIREDAPIPLLIKGILTAEDARIAVEHGVDGIVVSNHGGRQLDGSPAALDALVEVVEAVEGRCEVLMDGGIRRGTDVLKAVALGARAVLVARPVAWGLAAAGEAGVAHVVEILREELDLAMALCGCRSIRDVSSALVRPVSGRS